MTLHTIEHPLVEECLAGLRDRTTPPEAFRSLAARLTTLLAYEASRDLPTREVEVDTPLERSTVRRLDTDIVLVPVLRAGLGMLDVMLGVLPRAAVGYIGLERDEATAEAKHYYRKLPQLESRHVFVLDPMLATGGSASAAMAMLGAQGASSMRLLSIVAAPEGIERLEKDVPGVDIYTAAVDRGLDDRKFILPGLGDFGDRLYGTL